MDLKTLTARGGFAAPCATKVSVTWKEDAESEPLTFDVYVSEPAYGAVERVLSAKTGEDPISPSAALISICIGLGDDGNDRMTYEQAYMLKPSLAKVLTDAINIASAMGKENRSLTVKSSGTN